jgi:hypothetical protein
MYSFCYIVKFKYITSFEKDFIDKLRIDHNCKVKILQNSKIKNEVYRIKILFLFSIEKYIQKKFNVSRNFQKLEIHNIEHELADCKSDFFVNKYILSVKEGFILQEMQVVETSQILTAVSPLLNYKYKSQNYDQMDVCIIVKSEKKEQIILNIYEKDLLFLNNQIIYLRRCLIMINRIIEKKLAYENF